MQLGGWTSTKIAIPKIYDYLNKALALDPDFPDSYFIIGVVAYNVEWNWEKAEKEYKKALAINPSDAQSRIFYGHLLMCLQRPDEALWQGQLAVELDPKNPRILSLYSVLLSGVGDHEAAMAQVDKALAIDPEHSFAKGQILKLAYNSEDYDRAFEAMKANLYWIFEEDVVNDFQKIYIEKGFDSVNVKLLHELEAMAQNTFQPPLNVAHLSYLTEQYEKAIDWFEKGYDMHDPGMMYIGWPSNYELLHDNPRFIAILEKMNLPLPKD
jgi:tetratricopeptide (TPR) repeat protein